MVLPSESVVIIVTITQTDYAKGLRALVSSKANLARVILFWTSISFLAFILYSLISIPGGLPYRVVFVLFFVATMVVLPYAVPYWTARSFVKKNPDKLGPSKHEIGPNGASYQSVHGEGKLEWTAFHQIRETADFFLLYTQSNFAQFVPKRCFGGPGEISLYREIVRKHYKGKMDLMK